MSDNEIRAVAMVISRCVSRQTEANALRAMLKTVMSESDDEQAKFGLRLQMAKAEGAQVAWTEAGMLVSTLLAPQVGVQNE